MFQFPLTKPHPNFDGLVQMLDGQRKLEKVSFVELWIDFVVVEFISEKLFGKKLPNFAQIKEKKIKKFIAGEKVALMTDPEEEALVKGWIDFYYRMGYDYVQDVIPVEYYRAMIAPEAAVSEDTASITGGISKGKRRWAEEGRGKITSWSDFEEFPWERIANIELEGYYDFVSKNLPEGMKLMTMQVFFENIFEYILGYEGLFYLLYDEPDLVKAVHNEMGNIIYEYYKKVISLDSVGGIFHADDMGFKTSTLVSPKMLRELVLPWHKKFASLAHQHGKTFWLHSCGNGREIINDLIEDVKIDAYHSFQDVITPVTKFKKEYGNRIAVLGGVDMDKLCRLNERNLRNYVRDILNHCMPGGRYALGSGNSIANFVPVENFLIMLDEGLKWK